MSVSYIFFVPFLPSSPGGWAGSRLERTDLQHKEVKMIGIKDHVGSVARAAAKATLRSLRAATMFVAFLFATNSVAEQVNVNTADAETIAKTLNGVGLAKAQAIVEFREANGRFNDAHELTRVKGIGEATVRRNEGRIVVSEEGRAAEEASE